VKSVPDTKRLIYSSSLRSQGSLQWSDIATQVISSTDYKGSGLGARLGMHPLVVASAADVGWAHLFRPVRTATHGRRSRPLPRVDRTSSEKRSSCARSHGRGTHTKLLSYRPCARMC